MHISSGSLNIKKNNAPMRSTCSIRFMDDFLFFLCHLTSDIANGTYTLSRAFHRSLSRSLYLKAYRNMRVRRKNKRLPFRILMRSSKNPNKAPHVIQKLRSVLRKKLLESKSANYYKNHFRWVRNNKGTFNKFNINIDTRYWILRFLRRSLMSNSNVYSIYGRSVVIFHNHLDCIHMDLKTHGTQLWKHIFSKKASYFSRHV